MDLIDTDLLPLQSAARLRQLAIRCLHVVHKESLLQSAATTNNKNNNNTNHHPHTTRGPVTGSAVFSDPSVFANVLVPALVAAALAPIQAPPASLLPAAAPRRRVGEGGEEDAQAHPPPRDAAGQTPPHRSASAAAAAGVAASGIEKASANRRSVSPSHHHRPDVTTANKAKTPPPQRLPPPHGGSTTAKIVDVNPNDPISSSSGGSGGSGSNSLLLPDAFRELFQGLPRIDMSDFSRWTADITAAATTTSTSSDIGAMASSEMDADKNQKMRGSSNDPKKVEKSHKHTNKARKDRTAREEAGGDVETDVDEDFRHRLAWLRANDVTVARSALLDALRAMEKAGRGGRGQQRQQPQQRHQQKALYSPPPPSHPFSASSSSLAGASGGAAHFLSITAVPVVSYTCVLVPNTTAPSGIVGASVAAAVSVPASHEEHFASPGAAFRHLCRHLIHILRIDSTVHAQANNDDDGHRAANTNTIPTPSTTSPAAAAAAATSAKTTVLLPPILQQQQQQRGTVVGAASPSGGMGGGGSAQQQQGQHHPQSARNLLLLPDIFGSSSPSSRSASSTSVKRGKGSVSVQGPATTTRKTDDNDNDRSLQHRPLSIASQALPYHSSTTIKSSFSSAPLPLDEDEEEELMNLSPTALKAHRRQRQQARQEALRAEAKQSMEQAQAAWTASVTARYMSRREAERVAEAEAAIQQRRQQDSTLVEGSRKNIHNVPAGKTEQSAAFCADQSPHLSTTTAAAAAVAEANVHPSWRPVFTLLVAHVMAAVATTAVVPDEVAAPKPDASTPRTTPATSREEKQVRSKQRSTAAADAAIEAAANILDGLTTACESLALQLLLLVLGRNHYEALQSCWIADYAKTSQVTVMEAAQHHPQHDYDRNEHEHHRSDHHQQRSPSSGPTRKIVHRLNAFLLSCARQMLRPDAATAAASSAASSQSKSDAFRLTATATDDHINTHNTSSSHSFGGSGVRALLQVSAASAALSRADDGGGRGGGFSYEDFLQCLFDVALSAGSDTFHRDQCTQQRRLRAEQQRMEELSWLRRLRKKPQRQQQHQQHQPLQHQRNGGNHDVDDNDDDDGDDHHSSSPNPLGAVVSIRVCLSPQLRAFIAAQGLREAEEARRRQELRAAASAFRLGGRGNESDKNNEEEGGKKSSNIKEDQKKKSKKHNTKSSLKPKVISTCSTDGVAISDFSPRGETHSGSGSADHPDKQHERDLPPTATHSAVSQAEKMRSLSSSSAASRSSCEFSQAFTQKPAKNDTEYEEKKDYSGCDDEKIEHAKKDISSINNSCTATATSSCDLAHTYKPPPSSSTTTPAASPRTAAGAGVRMMVGATAHEGQGNNANNNNNNSSFGGGGGGGGESCDRRVLALQTAVVRVRHTLRDAMVATLVPDTRRPNNSMSEPEMKSVEDGGGAGGIMSTTHQQQENPNGMFYFEPIRAQNQGGTHHGNAAASKQVNASSSATRGDASSHPTKINVHQHHHHHHDDDDDANTSIDAVFPCAHQQQQTQQHRRHHARSLYARLYDEWWSNSTCVYSTEWSFFRAPAAPPCLRQASSAHSQASLQAAAVGTTNIGGGSSVTTGASGSGAAPGGGGGGFVGAAAAVAFPSVPPTTIDTGVADITLTAVPLPVFDYFVSAPAEVLPFLPQQQQHQPTMPYEQHEGDSDVRNLDDDKNDTPSHKTLGHVEHSMPPPMNSNQASSSTDNHHNHRHTEPPFSSSVHLEMLRLLVPAAVAAYTIYLTPVHLFGRRTMTVAPQLSATVGSFLVPQRTSVTQTPSHGPSSSGVLPSSSSSIASSCSVEPDVSFEQILLHTINNSHWLRGSGGDEDRATTAGASRGDREEAVQGLVGHLPMVARIAALCCPQVDQTLLEACTSRLLKDVSCNNDPTIVSSQQQQQPYPSSIGTGGMRDGGWGAKGMPAVVGVARARLGRSLRPPTFLSPLQSETAHRLQRLADAAAASAVVDGPSALPEAALRLGRAVIAASFPSSSSAYSSSDIHTSTASAAAASSSAAFVSSAWTVQEAMRLSFQELLHTPQQVHVQLRQTPRFPSPVLVITSFTDANYSHMGSDTRGGRVTGVHSVTNNTRNRGGGGGAGGGKGGTGASSSSAAGFICSGVANNVLMGDEIIGPHAASQASKSGGGGTGGSGGGGGDSLDAPSACEWGLSPSAALPPPPFRGPALSGNGGPHENDHHHHHHGSGGYDADTDSAMPTAAAHEDAAGPESLLLPTRTAALSVGAAAGGDGGGGDDGGPARGRFRRVMVLQTPPEHFNATYMTAAATLADRHSGGGGGTAREQSPDTSSPHPSARTIRGGGGGSATTGIAEIDDRARAEAAKSKGRRASPSSLSLPPTVEKGGGGLGGASGDSAMAAAAAAALQLRQNMNEVLNTPTSTTIVAVVFSNITGTIAIATEDAVHFYDAMHEVKDHVYVAPAATAAALAARRGIGRQSGGGGWRRRAACCR